VHIHFRLRDGRIYGTFCCFSYVRDHSLNQRDLNMMRAFAVSASSARPEPRSKVSARDQRQAPSQQGALPVWPKPACGRCRRPSLLPLVCARMSATQARIASAFMSSAPQPPSPPALATAIASEVGQAPAIGTIKIGRLRSKASQNARARTTGGSELTIGAVFEIRFADTF
jgi:hypothetical protein